MSYSEPGHSGEFAVDVSIEVAGKLSLDFNPSPQPTTADFICKEAATSILGPDERHCYEGSSFEEEDFLAVQVGQGTLGS